MSICSPKTNKDSKCLPYNVLVKIADIINKNSNTTINIHNNSDLYNDIQNHISRIYSCKNEKCWMETIKLIDNIPHQLLKEFKSYYKPKKPKNWINNKNTWLTSEDIDKVLKQYTDKHPNFFVYNSTPIDFDLKNNNGTCKINDLCKIDIMKLYNKYDFISIVFNTDPHYKSGQHWICLFIDLKGFNQNILNENNTPCIYFFDSVGSNPPKEVTKLINKIREQGKKNNIIFDYYYNDIQYQKGTTECGIYCIHFITYMLTNGIFHEYVNKNLSDEFIEKYRSFYFI